ncbi:MAG: hypothetical protein M3Y64_01005, partial [Gemmatimonadota bacterium]|nr:hypothetical protein [Gemmatimonadota bacterium]
MPLHDDANKRRSDSYPALSALTPSQRVRAVTPLPPVTNTEAGVLVGLILYTMLIAAWLASGSVRLAEWHLFARVAPLLVIVAAQTLTAQVAMSRDTEPGIRSFWRIVALSQLLLATVTSVAIFLAEQHRTVTAQTVLLVA